MEDQSSGKNKSTVVIIVLVVIIGLAGGWYLGMYKPEQVAKEKVRQEQVAKAVAKKKREEAEVKKSEIRSIDR